MAKLRIKWNTERILGISAMSISFITLLIFIYQTNLLSKQNYLAILPYVDISTTNNSEKHIFEVNISNQGVGPAILESVVMHYKGKDYNLKDYNDDVFELLVLLNPSFDSIQYFSQSTLYKGLALPANTTYNIFAVKGSPKDHKILSQGLDKMLKEGLDYQVIYKSIQDERWLIHLNSEGPIKLD